MPRVPYDLESRRPYLAPVFSDAEYDRRVTALRTAMAREGLDALCIFASAASPPAVAYLTNYTPAFGSAFCVLRSDGGMTVVTEASASWRRSSRRSSPRPSTFGRRRSTK